MSGIAGKTIAVTGTGGFLGRLMAVGMSGLGARVHAFARTAPDLGAEIIGHGWDPTRDSEEPAPGLEVDAVIDCAAVIPAREPDGGRLKALNKALGAGARALGARAGGRVIYMSSQAAIGRPPVAIIDDSTPCAPEIPYGEAKLAGERALRGEVERGRLTDAIALRLPAVVGVGCHDNFPATVAARVLEDQTVTVFNANGAYNAVVDAQAVVDFAAVLVGREVGFEAFSLASTPPITVLGAVQAIAEGLGKEPRTEIQPSRQNSPTIDPRRAAGFGFRIESPIDVLHRFGRATAAAAAIAGGPATR